MPEFIRADFFEVNDFIIQGMKFGAHVSIGKGIEKAPGIAYGFGCECFQIFSRSPHGGKPRPVTDEEVAGFKKECAKYKLNDYYIHTPYYINFASGNNRIYYGSISAVRSELVFADKIGAKAVVTHLGSAKDLGKKEAAKKLIEGIKKIFVSKDKKKSKSASEETKFRARLFLEMTAGAGEIMGDTFEEMKYFIEEAEKELRKNVLGVCFDTAHAFASGYDLRTEEAVKKTFDKFSSVLGIERLGLVHCNDSLAEFNSHVDRHDNIGNGKIGLEGFKAILNEPRLRDSDFVIETPRGCEAKNIEILKKIII